MHHSGYSRTRFSWLRLFIVSFLLAAVLSFSATASELNEAKPEKPAKRPNILLVLSDDLGYGDLACYGHPVIQSPNLDKFATEGIKLTNCYAAAANCSPSRTGLMTGRTPSRVGIHNWIPMFSPMHVKKSEITIATLLRQAGYATCHVGKWHLNGMFNLPGQPQPPDHGFDYWFSTQNNALPTHHNPINFVRNGKPVGMIEGYAAHIVADEAIRWMSDLRDKEKPFFMFVCFHEPHEPINSDPKYQKLYSAPEGSTLPNHHGNVTQLDDAFGRLMKAVDDNHLRDDTLVIFTSDNGPAITRRHPHGSAGVLRDKKGFVYEGGIRVPGMIRWPGHTKPGGIVDVPICGVDLLPTLCELTGTPKPTDRKLDGASWLPMIEGKPIKRTTPLYWHFNAAQGNPKIAMRVGDWKILAKLNEPALRPYSDIRVGDQESFKRAELSSFELYNLSDDISEKIDQAEKEPRRLAELSALMKKVYLDVREESPSWPAWISPRAEGKIISAYYKAEAAKKKKAAGEK